MKKIILAVLMISVLSGCSAQGDAYKELPEAFFDEQTKILEENLTILEKDPKDINALNEVGLRYASMGYLKKGIKYYKKVLAIEETDYIALTNIATAYNELNKLQKAKKYYELLMTYYPEKLEVVGDAVELMIKMGYPEAAQQALDTHKEELEKVDPDKVYVNLDFYFGLQQQINEAKNEQN